MRVLSRMVHGILAAVPRIITVNGCKYITAGMSIQLLWIQNVILAHICFSRLGHLTEFFFIVTVWHGLFFGTRVSWFGFLVPPLSKLQGKCIYKIFKVENQEPQFPLVCTKP